MKKHIWKLANKIRNFTLYKILKIKTNGVRVILMEDDKILLIKNSYDNFWTFPGGGIKRNETIKDAAIREVREETNYQINHKQHLKKIGTYKNNNKTKKDTVHLFVCYAKNYIKLETRKSFWGEIEIEKQGWFSINKLPRTSRAVRNRISEIKNYNYSDSETRRW
jgi:ADP-ribose pyrophosphatase YjhB (NUDIX family)